MRGCNRPPCRDIWCNWGGDNRNVTVRLSAEGGKKARLEHRMADAAANPYTTVATVLQAALLGVEGKYPLPADRNRRRVYQQRRTAWGGRPA